MVRGDEFDLIIFTSLATMRGTLIPMETRTAEPALAKKARDLGEGIVEGRAAPQMLLTITR
ncbi:hypothetical protein KY290_020031 [Solanum tuberosum]|uniref:Uncharacterized protein n=1 Tax=Solanum tuberosum TaxID=4113 RepID=A0ABQ7VKX3_SOLTU|nr:hypothetical protein KY290_020031 [Solanum tuberosum]